MLTPLEELDRDMLPRRQAAGGMRAGAGGCYPLAIWLLMLALICPCFSVRGRHLADHDVAVAGAEAAAGTATPFWTSELFLYYRQYWHRCSGITSWRHVMGHTYVAFSREVLHAGAPPHFS